MKGRPRRFTKAHPCPVCGGHDGLARGQGTRCFGYLDPKGTYARCTREERAGTLSRNRDGTYSHRLDGPCRCGTTHGEAKAHDADSKPRQPAVLRRFRSYFTLAAALRRIYGEGAAVRSWPYHDAEGKEVFRVVRVDYTDHGVKAKTYRPCHEGSDGQWRLCKPAGLLPLYNLPGVLAIPAAGTVAVLEGEKCADLARGLGIAGVTTSAHGAQAPQLTDWKPLAGSRIAILRDEGPRGEEYAGKVTAILAALTPPAELRVVRLPGLCDGEDIEQWAAARRATGLADPAIAAELRDLIAAAFA